MGWERSPCPRPSGPESLPAAPLPLGPALLLSASWAGWSTPRFALCPRTGGPAAGPSAHPSPSFSVSGWGVPGLLQPCLSLSSWPSVLGHSVAVPWTVLASGVIWHVPWRGELLSRSVVCLWCPFPLLLSPSWRKVQMEIKQFNLLFQLAALVVSLVQRRSCCRHPRHPLCF